MFKLSALEIRDAFINGEASAVSIAEYFLKRIDTHNEKLGAFLNVLTNRTLEKAKEIDEKRRLGKPIGRLACIPIAIKDNIHIKGEITTCASKFLTNYRAVFDATVVKLLEEEDALLIGKTNMDEFAMGGSTEHSALLQTHNPWNLACVPGGSSGGSAAAVAARLCPLGLGSDTGGSVRQPASFCGLIGFKPTYGRVSRFGLVAFGSSLDQIGTFATNTTDLALAMEVLGKHCSHDATSAELPSHAYLGKMKKDFKDSKIGVPWAFLESLSDEVRTPFENGLKVAEQLGAEIVDIDLSVLKYSIAIYYILATAEASTNLARFDGVRYGVRPPADSLDQLYALSRSEGFGAEVKRRILLGTYVLSSGYQGAYYIKAQKVRTLIINKFKEAFKQCDLVAMPTTSSPAFEENAVHDPLNMYLMDLYTIPGNMAGLPCLNIPIGFNKDNKPIGMQFIGPQMEDVRVVSAAHAMETMIPVNQEIPELFNKE